MKVVLATDLYLPVYNGVSQFTHNLAVALAKRGHDVLLIASSPTGKKYQELVNGFTIARLTSLPLPFFPSHRIALAPNPDVKKLIKTFKPDVVHIQTPLGIGLAARSAAKKLNIAVVSTNHAMPQNLIDNLKALAPFTKQVTYLVKEYGQWFHAKNVDYITMPTQAAIDMYEDISRDIDAPIKAISCGIDLSRFNPGKPKSEVVRKFGVPTSNPVVLYAGRLDGEKHISTLIDAAHILHETKKFHLVLSGGGNDEENLKEQAARLGMSSYVIFLGRPSTEELPDVYKMGNIFVMPSPAELQSIVTMEAMATGLPVVAVDKGAVHELCQDGRNGYICETDNAKDMAAKISKILGSKKIAKSMQKQSLAIAAEHDVMHTAAEYEDVYEQAIKICAKRKRPSITARLKTLV